MIILNTKFVIAILTAIILVGSGPAFAQSGALNLGQILSELQAESAVITLAQKNDAIIKSVQQRGVTFTLNTEIEKELRTAGASDALIQTIRSKAPGGTTTGTATLNGPFKIVPNITQEGVKGMQIVANFSVEGMKDTSSDIVYRFQKDGEFMKGKSAEYSTQAGDLSARRLLKPAYDVTVYKDLEAFLPYKEFGLAPGTYDLKLDADVIMRDGKLVKHLTLQDVRITIPSTTVSEANATFEKIWIDYNVNQGGQLGMVVHVTAVLNGLNGKEAYLQLLFEKDDGTRLNGSTTQYKSPNGQTAGYSSLKPIYSSARFNDIKIFVPYSEFNLPVGKHLLKIHADVVYPDYTAISHLTYYDFEYTRNR
ncbi:MAG: hypothetical protein IPM63_18710 [Acidobacteriota bacterium]|nr:MAG: hypothetical protein IPM63_18710 [Acidobacteriota bacterium]